MVKPPKLLVVSKTVFHTFYDCNEKLCEFVKIYNVVLPHKLAIECVISDNKKAINKDPVKLLIEFNKAIKARAKTGYQSPELLNKDVYMRLNVNYKIDGSYNF